MRAITLTQPWCGLMAAGIKRIENRSRPLIKRDEIGIDIAFHASREIDERVYARIRAIDPSLAIDREDGTFSWRSHDWVGISRLTSAVTHVAKLVDILVAPVDDDLSRRRVFDEAVARGTVDADQWRWWFGHYGYVFRDERILREPTSCRGWQGCWTLHGDIERQVTERLR